MYYYNSYINSLDSRTSISECTKPLTSREEEINFLKNFLIGQLQTEESSSIYISGQPGTGKTASLSHILQLPEVINIMLLG